MRWRLISILFLVTTPLFAASLFVTNVNDSGPGSLRQAILDTYSPGTCPCEVVFNIPGTPPLGYWSIEPLSALPSIYTDHITIDGATQTAFGGDTNPDGPEIVLSGRNTLADGLGFYASPNKTYGGSVVVNGLGFEDWYGF